MDSQTEQIVPDIFTAKLEPNDSWHHFGFTLETPLLTIRDSLFTLVFEDFVGDWDKLRLAGADTLFSMAIVQIVKSENKIVAYVGPAAVNHVLAPLAGDDFRGRLDVQLMGTPSKLEMPINV